MSDSAILSTSTQALSRDHETVEQLIARLRSATELTSLLAVLQELDDALVVHFAHEESPGGIYELMGLASPMLRTPLGNLLGEHYEMLADIRALGVRGRGILERAHLEIHAEACGLADRLSAHEAREDAMAAGAFRG